MEEETSRLVGLVEDAEACIMDAEVAQQTMEIDLSTRYNQWLERGETIGHLKAKVEELMALSHSKDEEMKRMTQQLAEYQKRRWRRL